MTSEHTIMHFHDDGDAILVTVWRDVQKDKAIDVRLELPQESFRARLPRLLLNSMFESFAEQITEEVDD